MPILDELVDLVAGRAVAEGSNESSWPGLTYHRFNGPARVHGEITESLSIHVVLQGCQRMQFEDQTCDCGPSEFFVVAQGTRLVADVLESSRDKPLLAVSLQIDPVLAIEVLGQNQPPPDTTPAPPPPPVKPGAPPDDESAFVSPLGHDLIDALYRFVRATESETDRHVLAPLVLRETAYRVLRSGQWAALAKGAHLENAGDRIAAAISFMRDELAEPITVEDMANHVSMRLSTFAHLFKATTGSAPYQYLKRLRLDRARALLVEENQAVGDACRAVGYGSVSHFITEFKRAYGDTPRSYASRQRRLGTLPRR